MDNDKLDNLKKIFSNLDKVVQNKQHLLVITHNNPDPDAKASAAALCFIVPKRYDLKTSIAYSGYISRAENQEMVRLLNIHMKKINRLDFSNYDLISLVDSQPNMRNNEIPRDVKCHVVIDHHPKCRDTKADFVIVKSKLGATATILVDWLQHSNVTIPTN